MSASAEDVDVVLPKESCLTKVRKSPGRFIDGLKQMDWKFVGQGVAATIVYWGVSFGYMMIFLSWLYADYESQRIFNLAFFFSCLAIVLVITLVKQYYRTLEDSEAEQAMKGSPDVNVPKVGDKDWTKNKTGSFEVTETVQINGKQEPVVHDANRDSQRSHHGEF